MRYHPCHTWLDTQLGKYSISLMQYQMCLATLVSSQCSCKFNKPFRLLKGLRYCCITAHLILWTKTGAEKSYSAKEGVSIISHQQVRLCGNTLFYHVTSHGMCGPSPWLKLKLYQYEKIGDENSKSWYLTGPLDWPSWSSCCYKRSHQMCL